MRSAQATDGEPQEPKATSKMAGFLFVQNTNRVTCTDGKLTFEGVNPATVMFSDRPERIAGHMTTARFVPFWSEGSDSFLKDLPNATLSFLEDETLEHAVDELRDPVLAGNDLSYQIKVLEGTFRVRRRQVDPFRDLRRLWIRHVVRRRRSGRAPCGQLLLTDRGRRD